MASILDTFKPLIDRGTKLTTSAVGGAFGQADALRRRVFGGGPAAPKQLNDQTLKSKVESELFRLPGISRSKVNITVADGEVTVHGEARNQAQMSSIETVVRRVPEVRGYESRLHLPQTPAPSTPRAGQRKATARKPAGATKAAARGRTERVNRDRTTAPEAEPKPSDLAARREGRQPAPMGSHEPEGEQPERPAESPATTTGPGTQAQSETASLTSGDKRKEGGS